MYRVFNTNKAPQARTKRANKEPTQTRTKRANKPSS